MLLNLLMLFEWDISGERKLHFSSYSPSSKTASKASDHISDPKIDSLYTVLKYNLKWWIVNQVLIDKFSCENDIIDKIGKYFKDLKNFIYWRVQLWVESNLKATIQRTYK